MKRTYKPSGETIRRFHLSKAFFRGIRGPWGSGKTVACCYELWHMAMQQNPSPVDGWKRTKWLVVRNTYPELESSTLETWLGLFPESVFGRVRRSPPFKHVIRDAAKKFEMIVVFVALEDERNTRDLLSTDWTGAFINEAKELPKGLIDNIDGRTRRFPGEEDGWATRPGIIADTNAPASDHWWPILSGEVPIPDYIPEDEHRWYAKPDSWEFFVQPPALLEVYEENKIVGYEVNPGAENLHNLHPDYYKEIYKGKSLDWIRGNMLNLYTFRKAGKPVYPEFSEQLHVFKEKQVVGKDRFGRSVYSENFVGIDFGLTPAAVVLQRAATGRYRVLAEFVADDMTIPDFGVWLSRELAALGLEREGYEAWGDPAGDDRDQQGDTAYGLMRAAGINILKPPTNDPSIRIATVSGLLTRLIKKEPAFKINPNCSVLIEGFVQGYCYRRMKVHGERYEDKPDKRSRFSHVHDALQYAALGAGEGRKLLGAFPNAPVVTKSRNSRLYVVGGGKRERSWHERGGRGVRRWQ